MQLLQTILQRSYFITMCRYYYQHKKLFVYPLLLVAVVFIHWELLYPYFPSIGFRALNIYLGEFGTSFIIQLLSASLFYQLRHGTVGKLVLKKQIYQLILFAAIDAAFSVSFDYAPIPDLASIVLYFLWKIFVLLVVLFLVIDQLPLKHAFIQATLLLLAMPKLLLRLAFEGMVGFIALVVTIFSAFYLINRFLEIGYFAFAFLLTASLIVIISLAYLFLCKGLLIHFEQYKENKRV